MARLLAIGQLALVLLLALPLAARAYITVQSSYASPLTTGSSFFQEDEINAPCGVIGVNYGSVSRYSYPATTQGYLNVTNNDASAGSAIVLYGKGLAPDSVTFSAVSSNVSIAAASTAMLTTNISGTSAGEAGFLQVIFYGTTGKLYQCAAIKISAASAGIRLDHMMLLASVLFSAVTILL